MQAYQIERFHRALLIYICFLLKKASHDYFSMTGVANLNFWHGFDRVITGLAEYYKVEREQKAYFNIVGSGTITEELKDLCKQKGVEEYVRFLGPKQGSELDKILDDTDLCVGCLNKTLPNTQITPPCNRGLKYAMHENIFVA